MALELMETGTPNSVSAEALKDGSLITVPWVLKEVAKGNVYHAYIGSATTPVTLDAAYANTDPDISLDVPSNKVIVPLCIRAVLEAYGSSALFEVFTLCSRTLAQATAGTQFTPINMRTRDDSTSQCEVFIGPTITNCNTNGAFELGRQTIAKVATVQTGSDNSNMNPGIYEWNYTMNTPITVLEGPASMATWVIAQASSGYLQYWWVELDSDTI